jgi:hypothetical protein
VKPLTFYKKNSNWMKKWLEEPISVDCPRAESSFFYEHGLNSETTITVSLIIYRDKHKEAIELVMLMNTAAWFKGMFERWPTPKDNIRFACLDNRWFMEIDQRSISSSSQKPIIEYVTECHGYVRK